MSKFVDIERRRAALIRSLKVSGEQMDPAWNGVVFPGHIRNQFLEQFGSQLSEHLCHSSDTFHSVSMKEVLFAFDVADKHIGLHWPFLATNLWRYGSHVLASAYFETSGTVADAMRGMLSTNTAMYPVFSTTSQMTPDALFVQPRPTFALAARHWNIFIILALLSETAIFRKFAPDETKEIEYSVSAPENEFSDTLMRISTARIKFDVPLEEAFVKYPKSLLQKTISHVHPVLNRILLSEIQHQTRLPSIEDENLNKLRQTIHDNFPKVLLAKDAAEALKMSRSSLQRLLKRKGLSYNDILLELRREYVLIYFSRAEQEAKHHKLLGFASPRALRAFCMSNFGVPINKLLSSPF